MKILYRKKELPLLEILLVYQAVNSIRLANLSMTSEPIRSDASSPTADVNHVMKKGALATICNSVAMVNIEAANNSEK